MIAFDTNILIYAEAARLGDVRHSQAAEILAKCTLLGAVMPLQVLGEFLHVCRRKSLLSETAALERLTVYAGVFETPGTTLAELAEAHLLSTSFNLQFFDAVIIAVSRRAGAAILLSEDMQDGQVIEGLTIINPFAPANASVIADWLGTAA